MVTTYDGVCRRTVPGTDAAAREDAFLSSASSVAFRCRCTAVAESSGISLVLVGYVLGISVMSDTLLSLVTDKSVLSPPRVVEMYVVSMCGVRLFRCRCVADFWVIPAAELVWVKSIQSGSDPPYM